MSHQRPGNWHSPENDAVEPSRQEVAMNKYKVDANAGIDYAEGERLAQAEPAAKGSSSARHDATTSAVAIGVVVVGAALFEVALVPGIVLGVAAAFAPKYLPKLGERLQPLFNASIRGAYKVRRKARAAADAAPEQMHAIATEVRAEEAGQDVVTPETNDSAKPAA
jgi:hypothetical protein